jgi:zinc transport system substrate-binding protein
VIEAFPGREPSAREMVAIVEAARRAQTNVLLVEPQLSPRLAEQVARELNGRVVVADPFGGGDIDGRDTYQKILRYNARVLAEALR